MTSTAEDGYLHCGPSGAGHFVKMIHNGIEYGMMQAYGEGFDILRNANSPKLPEDMRFDLPLGDIAELWRRGSVVARGSSISPPTALAEDPALASYTGYVEDSGEGRWTSSPRSKKPVPADVLSASLYTRFRSRQDHTFAEKVLSAMRKSSGGTSSRGARSDQAAVRQQRPVSRRRSAGLPHRSAIDEDDRPLLVGTLWRLHTPRPLRPARPAPLPRATRLEEDRVLLGR